MWKFSTELRKPLIRNEFKQAYENKQSSHAHLPEKKKTIKLVKLIMKGKAVYT